MGNCLGENESHLAKVEDLLAHFDPHPQELILINLMDPECQDCKMIDENLEVIARRFVDVDVGVITYDVKSRRAEASLLRDLEEDDLHLVLVYRDGQEVTRFRPAVDYDALEVKVKEVIFNQILPDP